MKAWILHDVGNIRYEETDRPSIGDAEVLVSVRAAGICGSDIPRIYHDGAHRMPLIPGHEFAGEVTEVGKKADKKWLHKRVGIFPLLPCGQCIACRKGNFEMCRQYDYLGSRRNGGFAEYAAVPEKNLIELPETVTFEQAAMLEPMAVAVHAMRRVNIIQSNTVIVCGLGTIGQLLVMFLLEKGIENIFVIGNKVYQKEKVIALGLPENHYCDSRTEDINKWVGQHTVDGAGADVFFECVGRNETVSQGIKLTAPGGFVCLVGNPYGDIVLERQNYWKILRNQLKVTGTWNSSFFSTAAKDDGESDWQYVLDLLKEGKISPDKLISHRFGLEYLEEGLQMMRDKSEDYLKCIVNCCTSIEKDTRKMKK